MAIAPSAPSPNPSYLVIPPDREKKLFQKTRYQKIPGPDKERVWKQIIRSLELKSGVRIEFISVSSPLDFELKLAKGLLDLAYMSPLQFVANKAQNNFRALVKPKAKPLRGVVVAHQDSDIKNLRDLEGKAIVFPGALDFAASIGPRHSLQSLNVKTLTRFAEDQPEAFSLVLNKQALAASGTSEALLGLAPNDREHLRVIWDTPGFTPYALAAKSTLPFYTTIRLQQALVGLSKDPKVERLLKKVFIDNGFEVAKDSDWSDIESIDLEKLNGPTRSANN